MVIIPVVSEISESGISGKNMSIYENTSLSILVFFVYWENNFLFLIIQHVALVYILLKKEKLRNMLDS